ncbi:ABC transporter ATP-binding protein [Pseudomonas chlororaphis]|uniref:Sulfate ester ABC transporter ATP-binding protein n=1 Tax=Pseudomonas chlororaphis TaxID=587753 RepID=A0AAX3FNA0_9PSED|nr:ABC transporter ATP-binding protein [Pseudomonas chlororaphis]AZC37721.1 ABC-type nitrate/sulfonate/bicarbonate transport system, ATPase component [Pseudomonas chlororaphis subsp. piscium]AZC44269.1 ABC-type nitrate/sulfonate/bicarbonate transport system, ATPase component [Pseudomonas chlororaphis subsp. piscium]WDG69915.1 ABC transporter ATP-binding protein [Pseudomonas chlororaphis]WDH26258.1 ABC transporter ATP-binding protein [Pseudomonas chlororaphis]WDH68441.1 ABC transporter ATP-bind
MTQALLDIQVERKTFAATTVLQDIHLQLQPREAVSLLGPSGCGKSTLLRIVAGLEKDFQGQLLSQTERLAFVFQEPRLMPWLTVEQNIGFSDDEHYDRAWVAQLIEEVGLSGFAQALPKALSGGMAQRVAIARGLYSRPQVLLLDEPFSAVDAFTRMKLQDLLLQLAERHAIALLLVTHDVDEALYLSDRVLVMDNRPSSIRQELAVQLSHPRDRRDPLLARLKALSLTELHKAHVI